MGNHHIDCAFCGQDTRGLSGVRGCYSREEANSCGNYEKPTAPIMPAPDSTRTGDEGTVSVPVEPTEEMWSGLARQIVMWHRGSRPTGANLHRDLKNCGWPIPDWLKDEIEDADYVPPKGAVAVAIYRAMIAARPAAPEAQGAETFPKPRRKDSEPPCGECHLQPGETCDICDAVAPPASSGQGVR